MDHSYWKEQLTKYRTRSLTSAEEELLWDALGDAANAEGWNTIIGEMFREQAPGVDYSVEDWEPVLQAVLNSDRVERPAIVRRMPILRRVAAAAVVAGLLFGGYRLLTKHPTEKPAIVQTTAPADIPAPATNRATITLSNGQRVYLDSAGNGALAQQGNAQVVKEANGQVTCQVAMTTARELLYNTLTNPRGSRVVTLTLSDGTKVWLNAESSLRYPVIFTGDSRTVEISGEGYFEVKKKAEQPFVVQIKNGAKIEVLGTSFNINAYPDESSTQATLLDGSVRVATDKQAIILKPGQQAWFGGEGANNGAGNVAGKVSVLKNVDTAVVMAWKNGWFAFRDADLPTVMRQLARWYDIDVSYEGHIPQENYQFNGKIGKNLSLDNVLDLLTNARVHYRVEPGNKLVIRP
jgi:ferric-dicitrate binding protein FerR (iron transport regulator)